jgi:hypothetical protein
MRAPAVVGDSKANNRGRSDRPRTIPASARMHPAVKSMSARVASHLCDAAPHNLHQARIHPLVRSCRQQFGLPTSAFLCGCAEKNHLAWDIMLFQSSCDADSSRTTGYGNEVVPARMSDAWKGIHWNFRGYDVSNRNVTAPPYGLLSELKPIVLPPWPTSYVALHAVLIPYACLSTLNPFFSIKVVKTSWAWCSSQPSSGWPWISRETALSSSSASWIACSIDAITTDDKSLHCAGDILLDYGSRGCSTSFWTKRTAETAVSQRCQL